ncbi:MAG: TonB-dependent receptor [Proteobacteria bacterium]|nr:TonB-dependent receptor [Pseudomonadota bacterium]
MTSSNFLPGSSLLHAHRHRKRTLACLPLAIAVAMEASAQSAPESAPDPVSTIVVQGQKLTVESRIDRKIYTLPEDAMSSVGSLSDVLSVVPSIDVDPDGILSLRGDSHVLVLIDGKAATQFQGSKAGEALQSMSALDIERIEVMTTPPVQYESEGAAGVINIITRKGGSRQAASGSVQASLGGGRRSLVGANASYSGKTLSSSIAASYRTDYRQRTTQTDVAGFDTATNQVLASKDFVAEHARRDTPNITLSGEFTPNDQQSLSGSAGWSRRGGRRTYTQLDDTALLSGEPISSSRRLSSGHDPMTHYNATLKFTQKLSRPDESLDFSLHRSISHQREHYDYINESFIPLQDTFNTNLTFNEDIGATEFDMDYALPVSTGQSLKLGYAFEQEDYGFTNVSGSVDPQFTNDFRFRQRVHGIYQSYQGNFDAWAVLGGVRTEWTTTDALLLTNGSSRQTHYLRINPSVRLDRILSDQSTLSLGVARRVTRPDPDDLNPYVDSEHFPNLTSGNPDLKPQATQLFDLGYNYENHGTTYGLGAYYRHNTDSVTEVTEYLGGNGSLTTKANLPKDDSAGLEFSAAGRVWSQLSYSVSGNAFYAQIDGTSLGGSGLKATTGSNVKAKLDYRPSASDSAQVTFTRTDKRLTAQGSISAINIVNVGYKHSFTPALTGVGLVSDLFNGQRTRRMISTPSLTRLYERRTEGRIIYVGLSYAFGIAGKDSGFDYDSDG